MQSSITSLAFYDAFRWFLKRGMAVIFLHRQYSLQPFARHYRHADELVLDMFCVPEREGDPLVVKSEFAHQISQDIRDNHFVTCGRFSKPSSIETKRKR